MFIMGRMKFDWAVSHMKAHNLKKSCSLSDKLVDMKKPMLSKNQRMSYLMGFFIESTHLSVLLILCLDYVNCIILHYCYRWFRSIQLQILQIHSNCLWTDSHLNFSHQYLLEVDQTKVIRYQLVC